MKILRALAAGLMLAGLATMVSGCSVARHQETVGGYVDSSVVTTKIKAKLAEDPVTSATSIKVKTLDGGDVQLAGFAKSQREKDRAGAIARSVEGVTRVHNDLVVKP